MTPVEKKSRSAHETRAVHSTITAAPMADDDGSLEELTCPITNEVFLDPVLCVGDGMTYERVAAERWFKAHASSPMTGAPLDVPAGVTLVDNHVVRKQAAALLERRPDLKPTGAWHARDAVDDGATAEEPTAAEEPSAPPLPSSLGAPASSSSRSTSDASAPPTESAILTGSHRGGLRAFTLTNRAYACPERDARWENAGVASGAAFVASSADGSLLMSGAQNSSAVSMWRPARHVGEPAPAPVTARLRDWSLCGAVDPRGEWCAAAGRGKKLELWRVSDPGVSDALSITAADAMEADGDAPWHKDFVTCMTNLGDGAKLVYGGDDWTLRAWDVGAKRGGAGVVVGECSAGVTSVVSTGDGNVTIAGTDDGETHAFDARAGPDPVFSTFRKATRDRVVDTLDVERHGRVTCVAVAEDGARWAASGTGEGVKLYEPRMSWRETVASGGDASGLRCTAMATTRGGATSPSRLAIATEDGTVAAFDVVASAASGLAIERKFTIQPQGAPRATSLCAFAPAPPGDTVVGPLGDAGGGAQPRARSWFRTLFG